MKTKKTILYLFLIIILFIFVSFNAYAQLQTYYCAAHAKFVTDLDSLQDPSTCEAQGFTFTGNLCCSEDDDPNDVNEMPVERSQINVQMRIGSHATLEGVEAQ